MQKRDVLNSAKVREKKRKARKRRLVFSVSLLFVLCAILVLVSRLNYFAIKGIVLEEHIVTDTALIRNTVHTHLDGNYFLFIPKDNFLLYPEKAIVHDLYATFPRIKNVRVSRAYADHIAIEVEEYTPTYLWCGENLPEQGQAEECYFLDAKGYIFSQAPYFSGDVYFKFYGGGITNASAVGAYFLDSSRIEALFDLSQSFRDLGFEPYGLFVDAKGEDTLLAAAAGRAPHDYPRILFQSKTPPDAILANLKLALTTEPLASKIEFSAHTLKYIDLRYENRVYYKFDE
ncbi:MAG: FtsQ-type POTRA domain-containing protein [Candidatus Pacebacteria bacterium]|jgi:cell division septal protein FtsQ|nr:FtsQ-type POTRA domain-containing protein [Candidatus Paceibacterota bacterium]